MGGGRQVEGWSVPHPDVEFELLGHPPDAPTLRLDYEQFAYAGKFVLSGTGKAVVRDPKERAGTTPTDPEFEGGETGLVGATSFSADRGAAGRVRIRYVTVRADRRGEGIGPRLLRFTAETLLERFDAVAIAVNNPIAYRACYRAGFVWTGEETGIAELLMRYAPDTRPDPERYRAGFAVFADRDLPDRHRSVVERHADGVPPSPVDTPERH